MTHKEFFECFNLIFVGIGVLIFLFKLYVAQDASGGVPVLDGVLFPPLFAIVGLVHFGLARRLGTGDWIYYALWFGMTIAAYGAICYVGRKND